MNRSAIFAAKPHYCRLAVVITLLFSFLPAGTALAGKTKVKLTQALWVPKNQVLRVKGLTANPATRVELFDINGRTLARATGKRLSFSIGSARARRFIAPVRFSATDIKGRRYEDSVNVIVATVAA